MDNKKISKLEAISQCFLIGGGYSIKPNLKTLQDKLKDKFVISLNYSYKEFPNATLQCFTDIAYWKEQRIHKDLLNLPLIIAKDHCVKFSPNIIALKNNTKKWVKDLSKGIYCPSLTGTFAIALALYLFKGEIYLTGFDFGVISIKKDKYKNEYTHYNQDVFRHRGTSQFSHYQIKDRVNIDFGVFKDENILNVGLNSKMPFFKKISYEEFWERINDDKVDQEELREQIKLKLNTLDAKG